MKTKATPTKETRKMLYWPDEAVALTHEHIMSMQQAGGAWKAGIPLGIIGAELVGVPVGGNVPIPPGSPGGRVGTTPPGIGMGAPPGIVVALVEPVGMPGNPLGVPGTTPAFSWHNMPKTTMLKVT